MDNKKLITIVAGAAVAVLVLATMTPLGAGIDAAVRPAAAGRSLGRWQRAAYASLQRAQLLTRMSMQARREYLAKVHYLARVIRRANPHADANHLAAKIVFESHQAEYDAFLVTAVILAESRFRRGALSSAGARGLMQIRPSTATYICSFLKIECLGEEDLHMADYNIRLGVAYLKHLAKRYGGDIERALIAYNWGPRNLANALAQESLHIPEVTGRYTRQIAKHYQEWKDGFASFRAEVLVEGVRSMQG